MKINNLFKLGQIVYLITDIDQKKRIVTGIEVRYPNQLCYRLDCGEDCSFHLEIEISEDKNYSLN